MTTESIATQTTSTTVDPMLLVQMLMEDNRNLRAELRELSSSSRVGVSAQSKASRASKHVFDTHTGIAYRTESRAGKVVAAEYNLPAGNFVWYEVTKKYDPTRFTPMTDEEYENYPKKDDEKIPPPEIGTVPFAKAYTEKVKAQTQQPAQVTETKVEEKAPVAQNPPTNQGNTAGKGQHGNHK